MSIAQGSRIGSPRQPRIDTTYPSRTVPSSNICTQGQPELRPRFQISDDDDPRSKNMSPHPAAIMVVNQRENIHRVLSTMGASSDEAVYSLPPLRPSSSMHVASSAACWASHHQHSNGGQLPARSEHPSESNCNSANVFHHHALNLSIGWELNV